MDKNKIAMMTREDTNALSSNDTINLDTETEAMIDARIVELFPEIDEIISNLETSFVSKSEPDMSKMNSLNDVAVIRLWSRTLKNGHSRIEFAKYAHGYLTVRLLQCFGVNVK